MSCDEVQTTNDFPLFNAICLLKTCVENYFTLPCVDFCVTKGVNFLYW